MKKLLLLSGAILTAAAITAAEAPTPVTIDDVALMGISKNGKYTVSNIQNILMVIFDTEDINNFYMYYDEDPDHEAAWVQDEYMQGFGTCVANDGSVVGNATHYDVNLEEGTYTLTDNAVIFKEGEIIDLPVVNKKYVNVAHSITPDGSVICGAIGNAEWGPDVSDVMLVPAVWRLLDNWTYSEPEILPYPKKDFLGSTPQYVTAIAMSEDGNTIAGTVTASSGFQIYPIVYHRDAEGKWSYELPNPELYYTHPEIAVPAAPGDCPELKDFLSEEKAAEYDRAMQEWREDGGDWSTRPNINDYATDEERKACDAAILKWDEERSAYYAAVEAATAGSVCFTFNNVTLSPDGKYLGLTAQNPDSGIMLAPSKKIAKRNPFRAAEDNEEEPGTQESRLATPYIFNLEKGDYTAYKDIKDCNVTLAGEDGRFLGVRGDVYMSPWDMEAVVLVPGEGVKSLQDFVEPKFPEISTWIKDNMTHEVEVAEFDEFGDMEISYQDKLLSGIPFGTPDFSTITTYIPVMWDYDDAMYHSYIFRLPDICGVNTMKNAARESMTALRGGIVRVTENALVEIFTPDGKCVFRTRGNGDISTGLARGQYVVRATFADGTAKTAKAAF